MRDSCLGGISATYLPRYRYFSVVGYRSTSLHVYAPTGLHAKHPAGIPQDKGAPLKGTPQESCLLLSFLPARFGDLTIGLHSYMATWLREYARAGEALYSSYYSNYFRSDSDRQHQATRLQLHTYRATPLQAYALHACAQILPKKEGAPKGALSNETGSPLPNSHRQPRYACRSTS